MEEHLGQMKKCGKHYYTYFNLSDWWWVTYRKKLCLMCRICLSAKLNRQEEKLKALAKAKANYEDSYVLKKLRIKTKLRPEDIPQSMIDAYRPILKLKDKVKTYKDHLYECPTHGWLGRDAVIRNGMRDGEIAWRCRSCLKKSHRLHYEANKSAYMAKQREARRKKKLEIINEFVKENN